MAETSSLSRQEGADTDELPSLTIGNSDFPLIRQDGTLFVDKTAQIPRLLHYKQVFFARPRRFGKTMLASMLFELFMHGTEQFEGLAVYDTWPVKQCYPTIRISFYGLNQPETFESMLCEKLAKAFKKAGLDELYDRTQSITQLGALFVAAQFDLEARGSVWLIDEVGYPLEANLDHRSAFEANAEVLQKFFAHLRELRNVRFLFVTGIMRYQPGVRVSDWSFLLPGQDIINISMNPAYADLVGYTQAEVEANFAPYIERAAQLLGMRREAFLEQLKLYYGGFCFDANASASLYCPWSINSFFQQVIDNPDVDPSFANFWMNSAGGSQALRSFLSARHVKLDLLEQALGLGLQVRAGDFNDPAKFELELPVIMVQAGYLTLKKNVTPGCPSYNRAWYACGFPNLEIAAPFTAVAFAVAMAAYMGPSNFKQIVAELQRAVRALDMATMVQALNALLVAVGSELEAPLTEGQYHTYLSLSLRAAHIGCAVPAPTDTNQGRSEIELASSGKLRVIALKRLTAADASPKACLALTQQVQDQLLSRSDGRGKERHAVVLVLSEQEGQIVYWRLLSLDKVKLKQDPLLGEGWVVPLPLEESAEDKAAAADDAKKPNRSKKKSVKRGAAKQDVASDESQVATSGKVTPIKGEKDAGAAPSGEGEASAAACAGTAGKPQSEVKTNPALDKTDLFIAFDYAKRLAATSDNKVKLDQDLFGDAMMAFAANVQSQKGQHTPESIKSYVGRYIDVAQTAPTPNGTMMDRTFLEQQLVALLTKVL